MGVPPREKKIVGAVGVGAPRAPPTRTAALPPAQRRADNAGAGTFLFSKGSGLIINDLQKGL